MNPQLKHTIRSTPKLTREEEIDLITRYREHGCLKSRDAVIKAHLRMVRAVVERSCHVSDNDRMEDLWQEGAIGLLKAIDKFDPKHGIRFLHYASFWVAHYARAYLLKNWCRGVKVPGFNYNMFHRIVDADAKGKPVTGVNARNSSELKWALNDGRPLSLQGHVPGRGPVTEHGRLTLGESLPAPETYDADRQAHLSQISSLVNAALSDLTDNQRSVIHDIFWRDLTMTESAKRRGIRNQAVQQTRNNALKRLRRSKDLRKAVG